MKISRSNHWGWGFRIDLDGNLRDTFPKPEKENEKAAPKARPKWHVKKRLRKALAGAR